MASSWLALTFWFLVVVHFHVVYDRVNLLVAFQILGINLTWSTIWRSLIINNETSLHCDHLKISFFLHLLLPTLKGEKMFFLLYTYWDLLTERHKNSHSKASLSSGKPIKCCVSLFHVWRKLMICPIRSHVSCFFTHELYDSIPIHAWMVAFHFSNRLQIIHICSMNCF